MAFIKIENGVIVQKQPYAEDGFVEAPDHVVCGQTKSGNEFLNPPPTPIPEKPTPLEERLAALEGKISEIEVSIKKPE